MKRRIIFLYIFFILWLSLFSGSLFQVAWAKEEILTLSELMEKEEITFSSYSLPLMGPANEPRYVDVEKKALTSAVSQAWNWLVDLNYGDNKLDRLLSPDSRRYLFQSFISSLSWEFKTGLDGGKEIKLHLMIKDEKMSRALKKIKYILKFGEEIKNGFTGLIIDARGLKVKKSMSPRIFGASGQDIYGTMNIDPAYVVEVGVVEYFSKLEATKRRVGEHPLVIKATGTRDGRHFVVSDEDAEKIFLADQINPFLRFCRVGILMD